MSGNIEKVSIALTADMLAMVRRAVDSGDYASTSEVVREALRQWKIGRALNSTAPRNFAPAIQQRADLSALSPGLALMQTHRDAIAQLCRQYQVRRLCQFGSALRADFDASRSDVDFTVEFAGPIGQSPAQQYFDFKEALEQLLGRDINLVELAVLAESRLRRLIERTQVPLYAEAT